MIIINTSTIEDYIKVIEWALDEGMCWYSGSKRIYEHYWAEHGSQTCVIIHNNYLTYSSTTYLINHYTTEILNMEQFTKEYIINWFRRKYNLR